ncbi:LysR family transcriptional regulator [Streptomyces griseomycini]|uniref:DNA-binding transcriptional LysR family regulator n=1 Tax=Streptomyces griseomycini TaxID=66895 RepID=A0A7W7PX08_9ACTN|nr:LysR family transcriptional regulator [Streptomyces griseomycini]MBB4902872.1 DNA-binding transcriptional LysR family regulator [Streptomyces griseomycini]GGQ36782.1 transcriptional regulator [Streptomyces griseomycini]GGR63650.1 transcriptional regulator [Streptomyces griseomycini]
MNLEQLRYVVVLAEELHFGRTARRLGVQQPTLSQQVRKLEDELGVSLFDRSTREVSVTAAGRSFVAEARHALRHAERARAAARRTARGDVGELSLGFVGSAVPELLPRLLRGFRRAYPGVEVQVRELPSARQIEELFAGRIDVGILHALDEGAVPDGLVGEEVLRDVLVAALPRRHPLAASAPLPTSALADEPFVLFPRALGPALHDRVTRLTRAAGFEPRVVQEAAHMQTIVGLVAAEVGVSIVPRTVSSLRQPDVEFRRLTPEPEPLSMQLVWRSGETSPVVRNFRRLVGESGRPR